jgi:hypothetical protein
LENTRGLSRRPAAAGTEEGQRSQPRCRRSGSPATEPSDPGAKLDPPEHTQPIPAPDLDPRGERWPIFRAAGLADHPAALRASSRSVMPSTGHHTKAIYRSSHERPSPAFIQSPRIPPLKAPALLGLGGGLGRRALPPVPARSCRVLLGWYRR